MAQGEQIHGNVISEHNGETSTLAFDLYPIRDSAELVSNYVVLLVSC